MTHTSLLPCPCRHMRQTGLVKYLRRREFAKRYFLEIVEFMKAVGKRNPRNAKTAALRIIDVAKMYRGRSGKTGGTRNERLDGKLSRLCGAYGFNHYYGEWKKQLMMLNIFLYPYPIPKTLVWASFENRSVHITRLARKWASDIMSGDSFYKRNREYFTRTEARYFLSEKSGYNGQSSVIRNFFLAKCKARNMHENRCDWVSRTFAQKFGNCFNSGVVRGFLDLIARTGERQLDMVSLDDLCDFVRSKIDGNEGARETNQAFSFSGRTMKSVTELMHAWHASLLEKFDGIDAIDKTDIPDFLRRSNYQLYGWNGLGIENYTHETDSCTWIISELRNPVSLYAEGNKMKNCVTSYAERCTAGESAIFNVSSYDREGTVMESAATLEVNPVTKKLVQAKAKYNARVTDAAMNVITRWAKANGITVDL